MRARLTLSALLLLATAEDARTQERTRPVLTGRVTDALSGEPVPSATINVHAANADWIPITTAADDAGRFSVRLPREGPVLITVKRLGFRAQTRSLTVTGDSTSIAIALVRVAQTLDPLVVEERTEEDVLGELRRSLRSTDHTRVFEANDLAHTRQLLAGPFLLGQGGIARVPCQRTAGFLPAGVVRSVPVEHEPADIWWPCVMVRGKPVSVFVSIDGGPAQELSWISSRELGEFAMIAVTRGRAVRAYTKQYIAEKVRANQQ